MAVAVGGIQLTGLQKDLIGGNRAIYTGVATGGTEYPTGGATLEVEPEERIKLPEKFDIVQIGALGLLAVFVAPNKIKLFAEQTVGTSTETALAELKAKATMATAVAAVPFFAIGIG